MLLFSISSSAQEMNLVKTNLFSDLFGNYNLQYERVLSEKFSTSLSVNIMPKKGIPFAGIIDNSITTNEAIDMNIRDFKYSSFSFTPDFRIYFGEGYGKGFYLAPYLRYSQFNVHDFVVKYTNDESEVNNITLSGKHSTVSGGLMCGVQWLVGDYICLDWWILGLHGGSARATITGDPSIDLTQAEQDDLKTEFESVEVLFFDTELDVTADKVTLTSKNVGLGFRTGFSVGVRF